MMNAAWRSLTCAAVAVLVAGCTPTISPRPVEDLPTYTVPSEYFVSTERGRSSRAEAATKGTTYYFQTHDRRPCYGFHVPGTWELGRQNAMLRRIDGRAMVGVLLMNLRELEATSVDQAIKNAAERGTELYARELGRAVPWTLAPYARIPGVWHLTARFERESSDRWSRPIPRWYRAVGDDWIAQFSIGAPRDVDPDAFVDDVIRSLTTNLEPRCFETRLRELGAIGSR
jgi:hypothetical protein